jgi:hypothetical protein
MEKEAAQKGLTVNQYGRSITTGAGVPADEFEPSTELFDVSAGQIVILLNDTVLEALLDANFADQLNKAKKEGGPVNEEQFANEYVGKMILAGLEKGQPLQEVLNSLFKRIEPFDEKDRDGKPIDTSLSMIGLEIPENI